MNSIYKLLKVKKKTLLLVAGLVWGFAGFRVFTLGNIDVVSNKACLLYTSDAADEEFAV